ncbi:MAG: ATP-binding protein [Fimbriimonas sp.]
MGAEKTESGALEFFAGQGEMAARMRAYDWSKTPLGSPEGWPQSLKTTVRILLTSRFAMWMAWGPELTFFCNDAYKPTLGIKESWALGSRSDKVWEEIWPDISPRIDSVLETGVATWDEALLLFLGRSGFTEETYHTFSYSPIANDAGTISGMLCVVSEETDRVIGERRLALLRELAAGLAAASAEADVLQIAEGLGGRPDLPFFATYLFEPEGTRARLAAVGGVRPGDPGAPEWLDANDRGSVWPAHAILAGVPLVTVEDVQSRLGETRAYPWDAPLLKAAIVPIAQQGQERPAGFIVAGLNPFRAFAGSYRGFLELIAGQIASALANAHAFEAERQRAEELAKLDLAKTAFFSNVSHELRTPLTLMLGPLEDSLAETTDLPPAVRENLTVAHRNSLRLLRLVNTLLDFSRIEAGRVQAVYEATDLATLTAELASNFRSATERAGLRFTIDAPPLDRPVYVDHDMWEKVVLNLLSNALKHTFEGEIAVTLRREGEEAVLAVRDTGTGIPDEARARLFERFYRVEGAQGRTHEGTGIGLALVQELVRLHGGSVRVESEVGKGSAFIVSLPLGKAHLPADHVRETSAAYTSRHGASYVEEALRWIDAPADAEAAALPVDESRSRVVIADDNRDMREYLTRLLGERYRVEAVADGQEALDAVRRERPDLVLTDVMMPHLDGFGLVAAIRDDEVLRDLPILVLSARAGEEAKIEGLARGADDYLVKPFSASELVARVASHIHLAHERSAVAKALRESEARFRNMADNAPVMVWVTEPDGTCTYLSKSWYAFTGQRPEEALGLGWTQAVHPDDSEMAGDMFLAANARQTPFSLEYRLRRHDGVYRWAIDSASPRFGEKGEYLGYVGSVIDITERKAAEDTLREVNAELERRVAERTAELTEANREMEGFTYSVSHDLRAPLRAIVSTSSLLLEDLGEAIPPEQADMLRSQSRNALRLAKLIDDLLRLSRVSRQEMRRAEVDMSELAHHIAKEICDPVPLPCRFEIQEGMIAAADPHLIRFVLSNLMENAVKFSPGGGRIDVGLREEDGESIFFVRDQGVGFNPAYAVRIFEPFERLVSDKEFPGTGIGLANVKRIVERHHGRVWATSALGQGATFSFTLG